MLGLIQGANLALRFLLGGVASGSAIAGGGSS
jgi:hypothetical protein